MECGTPGSFSLLFDIEPQVRRSSGRNYNLCISPHKLLEISEQIARIVRAEQAQEYAYANILTLGFIERQRFFTASTLSVPTLSAVAIIWRLILLCDTVS